MKRDYKDYWNDSHAEAGKPYAVQSIDDPRLLRWLREDSNLERGFKAGMDFLFSELKWKGGSVLDVGAGVCWTSSILSRCSEITSVRAFDYSEHRIREYAPLVIQQFAGVPSKIETEVGDFWAIPDSDQFDLIVFCQALYMFPKAVEVLKRCHRQLRRGGVVMIACERIEPEYSMWKLDYWKIACRLIFRGRVDSSGRYRMVESTYRRALEGAGFNYHFQKLDYPFMPTLNNWPAGNYFGVKS